jgi:hypothetical protein
VQPLEIGWLYVHALSHLSLSDSDRRGRPLTRVVGYANELGNATAQQPSPRMAMEIGEIPDVAAVIDT